MPETKTKKSEAGPDLSAVKLTNEQFDVLLGSQRIDGESLLEALRDHLVKGLSVAEAWAAHAVTIQPPADDEYPLIPGNVKAEQFDLLIEGTAIRGEALTLALREHLVNGLKATEACVMCSANKSQFSTRMKTLRSANERAAKLSRFYK